MRRPGLVWNAGRPPPRMLTMVIAGVDQARGLQTHLGSRGSLGGRRLVLSRSAVSPGYQTSSPYS